MTNKIGFSKIVVKAINEETREFVGIASSISPDRDQDVLLPEGARFSLPMPLLWMHNHDDPIGEIYEAEVIEGGQIQVKGRVASVDEPPFLRERLNEAWAKLKAKLVRGLSVGFRPIQWAFIEGSDGVKYTEWDWYETSCVTVPANANATLSIIKKYGSVPVAPSGKKSGSAVVHLAPSGQSKLKGNKTMYAKQIKQFRESRDELREERQEIVKAAEGRTLEAEEQQRFDEISDQIKTIDDHVKRLVLLEAEDAESAEPVSPEAGQGSDAAAHARKSVDTTSRVQVMSRNAEKGVAFAQYVKMLGVTKGNLFEADRIAQIQAKQGQIDKRVATFTKAAVAAASTGVPTWAGNLVHDSNIVADFVDFLRPMTVIGRFGLENIPSLTLVPANVPIDIQTSGGNAQWVGEGKAKPLTSWTYDQTKLAEFKVATIAAVSQELLRRTGGSADIRIRDELARSITERLDTDFLNPAKALVAGISPASITNGAPTQASVDFETDMAFALGALIAAQISLANVVVIMSAANAFSLSRKKDPLGNRVYPDLTVTGGAIDGIPVMVTDYAGTNVVFVSAAEIYYVDEGGLTIDMSDQASLEMADNPTGSSTPTVAGATLVSMWQTNSVAFRAERFINWQRRRPAAVAYVTAANYAVEPTEGGGG